MTRQLYADPALYARLFPVDDEEVAFFKAGLAGCRTVLDAAGGGCELGRRLEAAMRAVPDGLAAGETPALLSSRVLVADRSKAMLRGSGGVAADVAALPFRDGVFDGAYSRLLGYGYALGGLDAGRLGDPARELGRVLRAGSPVLLEVPLARDPARLQGVGERASLPGVGDYRFTYWDLIQESPYGAVLAAEIVLSTSAGEYRVDDRLHVFTPRGVAAWLAEGGVEVQGYYAPYDLESFAAMPPPETMRAVVAGRRA